MSADKTKETKPEFNARYGKWLREMRLDLSQSVETVAVAVGVDVATIIAAEAGSVIEMYDALRLCEYFGVDD